MGTIEHLKSQLDDVVAEAKTLAAKSRLSTADRQRLPELRAEGERLANRIKAERDDRDAIKSIEDMLSGVTGPDGRGGRKAAGTGPWAKAMTTYLDAVGAKSLTPNGSVTVPSLSSGITTLGGRPTGVLGRITFIGLDGTDSFAFLRETVREHAASTVAKGETKPRSTYSIEKVEDRARTIAHLSEPMNRADLADIMMLNRYVEGALIDGVMLELEDQVINGAGSEAGVLDDLTGILNTSGIGSQEFATDRLVTARKAVTRIENLSIPTDRVAWVMSPATWEAFELMTGQSHYLMADPGTAGNALPVDRARRQLWGYPVDTSTVIGPDVALLGDWSPDSIEIHERENVVVDWTEATTVGFETVEEDTRPISAFERNQVVFRGEGRWGLAVKRPAAFIETEVVEGS